MTRTRFVLPALLVLVALVLALGACAQPTPEVVKETVIVTKVVEKVVTKEVPAQEKITLIITSGSGSAGSTGP